MQKKRESLERPMPTRKRTKMVDQRLSRSKISFGADPQQLLAAQHAAQHGPPSRPASPSLGVEFQQKLQSPPAPPPLPTSSAPTNTGATKPQEQEPRPVSAPQDAYVPPPRPVFAESVPSEDKYIPPPRPTFAEPDNENNEGGIVVSPPTPVAPQSPVSPTVPSVSTTPPAAKSDDEKAPLGRGSLARSGSGETSSRVRGPRVARTVGTARGAAPVKSPSPPGTSARPTHSRGQSSVSISSDRTKDYAPKKYVGKANAAIFSRRTQASDAEDNVLDK